MINVSKNIRHFRNASGLTQEALAEKISVTRQAISSWERGVTRPDINMIIALAENLGVSVEELIYGKVEKVGFEKSEKEKRKPFFVVLSVFGTLLVCAGLIILFAANWDVLGNLFKSIGVFVPLVAGFSAYMIIHRLKRDSTAATECAALIWMAGYMSTNALANSFFNADAGFENLFLLDMVLLVPMILITKAILPLLSLFIATALFPICTLQGGRTIFTIIEIVIVVPIYVFSVIYKEKTYTEGDTKKTVCSWFELISGLFIFSEIIVYINLLFDVFTGELSAVVTVIAFILAASVVSGDSIFGLNNISFPFALISSVYLSFMSVLGLTESGEDTEFLSFVFPLIAGVILLVFACIIRQKKVKLSAFEILQTAVILLPVPVTIAYSGDFDSSFSGIILSAISVIYGVLLIVRGMKSMSLAEVNLGLIEICFILCITMIGSAIETVVKGMTVLAVGILILVVNKILIGYFSKKKGVHTDE